MILTILNGTAAIWFALRLIFSVAGPIMFWRAEKLNFNNFSQTLLEEIAAPVAAFLTVCAIIAQFGIDFKYFGALALPIMLVIFWGIRRLNEAARPEYAEEKKFVLNYHLGVEDVE